MGFAGGFPIYFRAKFGVYTHTYRQGQSRATYEKYLRKKKDVPGETSGMHKRQTFQKSFIFNKVRKPSRDSGEHADRKEASLQCDVKTNSSVKWESSGWKLRRKLCLINSSNFITLRVSSALSQSHRWLLPSSHQGQGHK